MSHKMLSGIKAVQTLSRLNRAHPQKDQVFVLDFMNDPEVIQLAFANYYRTTVLSEGTGLRRRGGTGLQQPEGSGIGDVQPRVLSNERPLLAVTRRGGSQ